MNKLFLMVMVPIFSALIACGGGKKGGGNSQPKLTFEDTGLESHIVVQLKAYDDEEPLYAATDKGVHALIDNEWQLLTPEEWSVNAIEFLDANHILASVSLESGEALMESLDGGETWEEVANNFGGEDQEKIQNLYFDKDTKVLYAIGRNVLAQSEDEGREWTILEGEWHGFASGLSAVARHSDTGDLWIGGQGAIENPVLRQVKVDQETEDHSASIAELLEAPSVIKSIRFFPEENSAEHGERVLASGEGGIVHSPDYGKTWLPLFVNETSRFYFDVIIDPDNSNILYTAGWSKNWETPQELRLEISPDSGKTWKAYRHNDPELLGGVWSMTLRIEDEKKVLYLGLCKGGVYKVVLP